jgi:hypothetical protein
MLTFSGWTDLRIKGTNLLESVESSVEAIVNVEKRWFSSRGLAGFALQESRLVQGLTL